VEPELDTPRTRSEALRHALVSTADAQPYTRPRPRRKLFIATVGAFALAGALTAGAVTTAAITSSDDPTYIFVSGAAHQYGEHRRLVGHPQMASGSTTVEFALGAAPRGATTVVVAYSCRNPGFELTVGGKRAKTDCANATAHQPDVLEVSVPKSDSVSIEATSRAGHPFVLWASWAKPNAKQSVQQKLELTDGTVTRDEYLAAFNRMVGCMTAGGYPFDVPPETTTLLNFAVSEDSSAYWESVCYPREFQGVDAQWQFQHEDTSYTATVMHDCLVAHGITPAATLKEMDVQLTAAGIDVQSCLS
jgi:hypothetical protein